MRALISGRDLCCHPAPPPSHSKSTARGGTLRSTSWSRRSAPSRRASQRAWPPPSAAGRQVCRRRRRSVAHVLRPTRYRTAWPSCLKTFASWTTRQDALITPLPPPPHHPPSPPPLSPPPPHAPLTPHPIPSFTPSSSLLWTTSLRGGWRWRRCCQTRWRRRAACRRVMAPGQGHQASRTHLGPGLGRPPQAAPRQGQLMLAAEMAVAAAAAAEAVGGARWRRCC